MPEPENMHDKMQVFLRDARERLASDIHIAAGAPVMYRIGRKLTRASHGPITPELSRDLCYALLSSEQIAEFELKHDLDVIVAEEGARYRVNISINDGCVGGVIRLLPQPQTFEQLHLPPVVMNLAHRTKGLVLITGGTCQGKTTTMSAMIGEINATERKHIITIEDPIEVVHTNLKGIVRQREVGRDTENFHSALRAALRQDPDVLAIGEMRDYETIRIALTAAETGVLVFSTLHIISIDKMLDRLLSYVPPEEEGHVRALLADSLQGVIHQELVPTTDGGRRVACEVLLVNDAARNVLRRRGATMMRDIITTGTRHGMIRMSQSIEMLLAEGVITAETSEAIMANYQA